MVRALCQVVNRTVVPGAQDQPLVPGSTVRGPATFEHIARARVAPPNHRNERFADSIRRLVSDRDQIGRDNERSE